MPVGRHGYLALPPAPPRVLARLVDPTDGARFSGFGETSAAAERELAGAVGAWQEEREERSQRAWERVEWAIRGEVYDG